MKRARARGGSWEESEGEGEGVGGRRAACQGVGIGTVMRKSTRSDGIARERERGIFRAPFLSLSLSKGGRETG